MGTVRNAIQRYEVVLIGTLAASSAKTYMSRLRFAADRLPDSLSAVQLWHLEAVVATYRETRQPNTVALFVTVVKSFFAWCVDVELLKKDPALRLKAPKRTKWQPRALSAAAIDALLESIHTTTDSQDWRQVRNETIVRVMLFAGLRRAEVVQLMWEDVDMPGRALHVTGKAGKRRVLPLHSSLLRYFQALQQFGCVSGAIFSPHRGSELPLHPYTVNIVFQRWIVQRLGVAITPHQLRHSFATRLIERGASLDEVRDLLGHESLATTQVYVATSPERLRAAIERLTE